MVYGMVSIEFSKLPVGYDLCFLNAEALIRGNMCLLRDCEIIGNLCFQLYAAGHF